MKLKYFYPAKDTMNNETAYKMEKNPRYLCSWWRINIKTYKELKINFPNFKNLKSRQIKRNRNGQHVEVRGQPEVPVHPSSEMGSLVRVWSICPQESFIGVLGFQKYTPGSVWILESLSQVFTLEYLPMSMAPQVLGLLSHLFSPGFLLSKDISFSNLYKVNN